VKSGVLQRRSGRYIRDARRESTRRLLVEDVYTSSVSQNSPVLIQEAASRCRRRKRLRVFTACHTLRLPDREPLSSLLRRCGGILRPRRSAHPLSKMYLISHPNLPRTAGPAKLARLLPARAASANLVRARALVKHFLMRVRKFFQSNRASRGSDPLRLRTLSHRKGAKVAHSCSIQSVIVIGLSVSWRARGDSNLRPPA
jgi:hypothetical protein